jgi:hypothetical protein
MNKNHSIVWTIASLLVIVLTIATGAVPVSAQNTTPQDTYSELPDCSQLPECGYIHMHIQAAEFHTAVTVVPLAKPGIPVTGCPDSLYIGHGFRIVFGTFLAYGQ